MEGGRNDRQTHGFATKVANRAGDEDHTGVRSETSAADAVAVMWARYPTPA